MKNNKVLKMLFLFFATLFFTCAGLFTFFPLELFNTEQATIACFIILYFILLYLEFKLEINSDEGDNDDDVQ